MAIFHFHSTAVCRRSGRNAIAAVAYRSGTLLRDFVTGAPYDYRHKPGVLFSEIAAPLGIKVASRENFWNQVERHHKRGDAVVAREIEVALPCELSNEVNFRLASHFASWLAEKYQIVCDVSVHAGRPDTSEQAGNKNIHAHLLMSTCHIHLDGSLGKKCMLLDPIYSRRSGYVTSVFVDRLAWQCLCNLYLDMEKIDHMVDARSYQELGIFDSQPSTHIGPRNFAALKDENKKKPENAVCVDKSRRRKRKIADGWSLDSVTLTQLINTHLDLARLEAIESTGEDSFGWSPKEHLRFTFDWAYEVQLPDDMYVRPIAV